MTEPVLLNLLVAYPYMDEDSTECVRVNAERVRFVLDSGAFTAWKSGKPIQLDDYCNFIDRLPLKPWRYFTLDVIGDPHGTMQNYQTMLRRGFKPIPIFTRGEDISVLDEYYKTSDVVGIGGLVGTQDNRGFVKGIMKVVGNRRVHWLGFTNLEYVKHYRPYMCDSSNWNSAARYASLALYNWRGGFVPICKADFTSKPDAILRALIARYEIEPTDLATDKNWSGAVSPSRTLAARSAVVMSVDCQKKIGTFMFLATSQPHYVRQVVEAFKWLKGRVA